MRHGVVRPARAIAICIILSMCENIRIPAEGEIQIEIRASISIYYAIMLYK